MENNIQAKNRFFYQYLRGGRLVRCLFGVVTGVSLLAMPTVGYALDSDGDGLSDAVEGTGDADGDGTPNYLDTDSDNDGYSDLLEGGFDRYDPVTVPTSFTDIVDAVLTEGSNVGEAFINPAYKNDLVLSEASELRVTFIKEGAGNRNAMGYYVFEGDAFDGLTKADVDTDGSGIVSVEELRNVPGVETGWVFPNCSKLDNNGGVLVQGDSYILGDGRVFPAGSKVGFYLVSKGWVNDGSGTIFESYNNGKFPRVMFTTDFLNPTAESTANLLTDSSTNLSRQVALLFAGQDRSEIIIGFEDIWRKLRSNGSVAGDQDFNDAVFTVSSTTVSALASAGIATADVDGVDADGDGVLDVNEQAGDSDGDGVDDIQDPDDDGDGIVTTTEGVSDTDSDGTANYLDTDSDNDGIDDSVEGSVDTDVDGIANYLDTDSDNDGLLDSQEGSLDSDSDGTPDRIDSDDDGDSIATVEEGTNDSDGDGTADYLDTDSDNDSISDGDEAAGDTDGDGTLDRYDTDDDGDGILTVDEGNADSDGDGASDHLDTDSDNDGFSDSIEGQVDSDGDGLANRIDSDDDNDGVPSANESGADTDNDGLANYLDTDSDGDGVEDGASIKDVVLTATTRALQANYTGKPLVSGDQVEYTVTITNSGADSATTVEVEGLVPAETTYVDNSFTVDGSSVGVSLDSSTTVDIGSLAGGQSATLILTVSVDQSLPTGLNKISSAVRVNCIENALSAISDNDASGHCGIVDDGLDHVLDSGSDTDDDDPTNLPLMQGTFAESCILAFEDLQNAGWCDWDMNDIILDISSYYVVDGSNNVESMVVTYQLLARGAGYESRMNLNLPFSGAAEWQRIYLNQSGEIEDTIFGSGSDSASIVLWQSSKDALPPFTDLKYKWGAARTERFDSSDPGKIAVVNIHFDSAASNPLDGFSESPHDTWAWIPNTQQAIHRLMFNPASSQTVYEGPFFGESLPFAAKFDSDFVWPHEGHAIWLSHPDYVDFIKSSGTANLDWMETFNKWRVWHDDAGMTHRGDDLTSVSDSVHYSNYVETHYSPL